MWVCCGAWLPPPENCPEWKFQFNLVCHSWSAVPLMISMKFITLRLFAKLGTLSNLYLCLRSHIIYPLMSFWSYPIKSSWESNDQQNMETQTPAPRRGGWGEEMEDIGQSFHTKPGPTLSPDCVQMCNHNNGGWPNYSHHSQFLSHTYTYKTKQNAFNCICWSWEQYDCVDCLGAADSPHLWHNVYRQTEAWEKFLIMIPPVNVATFQMFINYRHADTNIQS